MSDVEQVPPSDDRFHARYLWAITVVTGIALWVVPMFSSFWLDETITWWVTEGDLGSTIRRALDYDQSALYSAIAWSARRTFGANEVGVRIPSLLFAIGAAWLLFRLASRLHDREVGRLVVLAFVASPWMALAASDARAYALGIFAIVAAGLSIVRWSDGGRLADALGFVAACAGAIWAHYVFGITVAVLLGWGCLQVARGSRITWPGVAAACVGIGLAVAPLAGIIFSLVRRSESLVIPEFVSLEGLLIYLARPVVIGGLVIGGLVARLLGPLRVGAPRTPRSTLILWVAWGVAAPIMLFTLGAVSSVSLTAPRYSSGAIPALAALVGLGIAAIHPAQGRRVIAAVVSLVVVFAISGTIRYGEEWRDAANFVRARVSPETPILLRPGLIEANQPSWVSDPVRSEYLTTPAVAYEFGGDVIPMPYVVDDWSRRYFEELIQTRLAGVDRFLFVARDRAKHRTELWWDARLRADGFESHEIGSFGTVYVVEFTRSKGQS